MGFGLNSQWCWVAPHWTEKCFYFVSTPFMKRGIILETLLNTKQCLTGTLKPFWWTLLPLQRHNVLYSFCSLLRPPSIFGLLNLKTERTACAVFPFWNSFKKEKLIDILKENSRVTLCSKSCYNFTYTLSRQEKSKESFTISHQRNCCR